MTQTGVDSECWTADLKYKAKIHSGHDLEYFPSNLHVDYIFYEYKVHWRTEHSTGNKTVPGKGAKTCTKDGHKQTTKTSTKIQTKRTKKHRTTEEEMEGPTSSGGFRNRLTCLTLQEHDDDDEVSMHLQLYDSLL